MSRECLFIGGPVDGMRIRVEDGTNTVNIPMYLASSEPPSSRFDESVYTRVLIFGPSHSSYCIFHSGDADPVAELIAGYKKGKAT